MDARTELQQNEELRARSGTCETEVPLVVFLYELMRDHLPTGVVERLVRSSQGGPYTLTNGWLGEYAVDLASRLAHETYDQRTEEQTHDVSSA